MLFRVLLIKSNFLFNINMRVKLSQHFLINKEIIKKIVSKSNLTKKDIVLEIGAGTGNLTQELLKTGAKIIAIEIDKRLVSKLKERFGNKKNIKIIQADILKYEIPQSITRIVSNLPYEISAPITEKLIKEWNGEYWCVLMYQQEFAEKMLAAPGVPWFSRISFLINTYTKCKELFLVGRENFHPIPKVDSMVVELHPLKNFDEKLIFFANCLFNHKNKTIKNSLISSRKKLNMEKKDISMKLEKVNKEISNKKVWQAELKEIKKVYNVFKKFLP